MGDIERHLVSILEAKRRTLDISGMAFARRLKISQSHWSLISRGRRRIGQRMAQRIVLAFPELLRDVQDVMFPRDPN